MEAAAIQEFLVPEVLILIPVLWLVGFFFKKTPKVPDWVVVWIILTLGIVASLFIVGFDINGVLQGVLVAGVSVLGYDLYKQTKKAAT